MAFSIQNSGTKKDEIVRSRDIRELLIVPRYSSLNAAKLSKGSVFYNTSNNTLYYSNGITWIALVSNIAADNIVTVSLTGFADFTNVNSALNSITTNSSTNPFSIVVAPGIYNEPPLIGKDYVSLIGYGIDITVIQCTSTLGPIYTAPSHSMIHFISLSGATTGIGLLLDSKTHFIISSSQIKNSLKDCVLRGNTSVSTDIIIRDSQFMASNTITSTSIEVDGTGGNQVIIDIFNNRINGSNTITYGYRIHGVNAIVSSIGNQMVGGTSGDAINVTNGGTLNSFSDSIGFWNRGLNVPLSGSNPVTRITSLTMHDTTSEDVRYDHTGGTGALNGVFTRAKTFIFNTIITLNYSDPTTNGTTIIGALYLGVDNINNENATPIIKTTPPLGIIDGGIITNGGGLNVAVSAGFGYLLLLPFPTHTLKFIQWSATSILTPATTTSYIFFNSIGVLSSSTVQPSNLFNIILGRVRTTASGFEFIDQGSVNVFHGLNTQIDVNRDILGAITASGLITSGNTSRQLFVTSGRYYFGIKKFTPLGASPIGFFPYFHVAGFFVQGASTTVVDNVSFDNGTALVAIPAGQYVKHTLYIIGDGAQEQYFMVFSQTSYLTLTDARSGNLPAPPSYFTESIMKIAGLIVQQGNATFIETRDERPIILGASGSGVTAPNSHSSLSNLLNDDHPQYFRTDGTRVDTGSFDLGGFSIGNVNLVDGVDVSAHASRHLPLGADSLTTASPTTDLSPTTGNTVGIANSLSRSDHTHRVIFGSEFEQSSTTVITTTTVLYPTPTNKIVFLTASKPIGTYRIDWNFDWAQDASRDFMAELLFDASSQAVFRSATFDSAGVDTDPFAMPGSGTDQRFHYCGFVYVTTVGVATHTLTVRFFQGPTGAGAGVATMGPAIVSIYRVL